MLLHSLTTTPQGDVWAEARACGLVKPFATHRMASPVSLLPVSGGVYGTGASKNGNKTRPMGLGGSAG
jgi:hypothetical protein